MAIAAKQKISRAGGSAAGLRNHKLCQYIRGQSSMALRSRSSGAQIFSGRFARPAVRDDIKADILPLIEGAHAGAFNRADMNKDVIAAIGGLNEAEALLAVKPLHSSCIHREYPFTDYAHVGLRRREISTLRRSIDFGEGVLNVHACQQRGEAAQVVRPSVDYHHMHTNWSDVKVCRPPSCRCAVWVVKEIRACIGAEMLRLAAQRAGVLRLIRRMLLPNAYWREIGALHQGMVRKGRCEFRGGSCHMPKPNEDVHHLVQGIKVESRLSHHWFTLSFDACPLRLTDVSDTASRANQRTILTE